LNLLSDAAPGTSGAPILNNGSANGGNRLAVILGSVLGVFIGIAFKKSAIIFAVVLLIVAAVLLTIMFTRSRRALEEKGASQVENPPDINRKQSTEKMLESS
jgi:predicted MFS family arabinose efflux permease